jgi:hypothetical protein
MVANTPYRLMPNGEIEALIQGGHVRFRNLDHLRSMLNVPTEKGDGSAAVTTYRGYNYVKRDDGIEVELKHGGTKKFPNEEIAV